MSQAVFVNTPKPRRSSGQSTKEKALLLIADRGLLYALGLMDGAGTSFSGLPTAALERAISRKVRLPRH